MNKRIYALLMLCCLLLSACTKPSKPYTNELKSITVDARSGQDYGQYAVYNPALSANVGIEYEDVDYAKGTFMLLNPTEDNLKNLSDIDFVVLYYNQLGQVIIEIKGK